jgi:hypothetical protein
LLTKPERYAGKQAANNMSAYILHLLLQLNGSRSPASAASPRNRSLAIESAGRPGLRASHVTMSGPRGVPRSTATVHHHQHSCSQLFDRFDIRSFAKNQSFSSVLAGKLVVNTSELFCFSFSSIIQANRNALRQSLRCHGGSGRGSSTLALTIRHSELPPFCTLSTNPCLAIQFS